MNIILFGAGEVVSYIAKILAAKNYDVVIVSTDQKKLCKLETQIDVHCITGDILNKKILTLAGCERADALIAVSESDTKNLVAASLAKKFGAKKAITRLKNQRVFDDWKETFQDSFGIDLILYFEQLTAQEIAKRIGTAGFYVPPSLSLSNVALQEWTLAEGSPFVDVPLRSIHDFAEIIVPVIFRDSDILIPSGNDVLKPKDRFFMVGPRDYIHKISQKLQSEQLYRRTVIIFGGGEIGFQLAKILENTRLSVKLIEQDDVLCKSLSDRLNKTLVLNGSCLEEDFLLQQGITHADVFVAVTGDEEENLMSALIAKNLGARETIVFSERKEYASVIKRLGIEMSISPKLIASNHLLQFLVPGRMKTLIILDEKLAEVVEVTLPEKSNVVGLTIAEAKFPKGLIIASVIRENKVIVPHGNLVLFPEDTLVIFTMNEHLPIIEKIVE